jgi:hypothetical protein
MDGSPCQEIRVNTLGKIVTQLFEPFCAFVPRANCTRSFCVTLTVNQRAFATAPCISLGLEK